MNTQQTRTLELSLEVGEVFTKEKSYKLMRYLQNFISTERKRVIEEVETFLEHPPVMMSESGERWVRISDLRKTLDSLKGQND